MNINIESITTVAHLKEHGYKSLSVKDELRKNLIHKLQGHEPLFHGIIGYQDTVIPDIERALLSRHNIILLGLRGQAKTRIARLLVNFLDEYIPVIQGSEINDDPFHPLSRYGRDMIATHGDDTPIAWLHRSERFVEKLATPDVSVADLIGDIDPIKAASLKLPYSDERVLHFGLIPRSHRCIFVMNELPDLQPRIQVSLFNILQEGDIQIRGFKLRLPLDIQFVFTANPEDYTNRGSIVTPLKDRIDSQILTHYPKDITESRKITEQEAHILPEQKQRVYVNNIMKDLIERVALSARSSSYVDSKSGVSARLTISAMENLVSAAERRALLNNEEQVYVRAGDIIGVIPSITGKIELVYEGEQEGAAHVAYSLLAQAIKTEFLERFPAPDNKKQKTTIYDPIIAWFRKGNVLSLLNDCSTAEYRRLLLSVEGLEALVLTIVPTASESERYFLMEFILHGLAEFSLLSKQPLGNILRFGDMLSAMMSGITPPSDDDDDDDVY